MCRAWAFYPSDDSHRPRSLAARSAAGHRPDVRVVGSQDRVARTNADAWRTGVHRAGTLHGARLDRMDRRVRLRRRAAPVRRHRRSRLSRARAAAHARADGASPHACRRSRSRLQQRQHLRRALAPGPRRADRGRRLAGALLRAGAQGQRRRTGAPLDDAAVGRVHSFVQRRPLVVRRHDSIAAGARLVVAPRPPPDRGTGSADRSARAAAAARARDRPIQRLLRTRPRHLRLARPRRPRVAVQRRQRHLPRTQQPAGLLSLLDLDTGTGLGDAGLRRTAGISRDAPRCRLHGRGPRCRRRLDAGGRPVNLRLLYRSRRVRRRHSLLGYRRAGPGGDRRLGRPSRRSVQRLRTRRQLRGGDSRARPPAPRSSLDPSAARRRPLYAGRTAGARHAAR